MSFISDFFKALFSPFNAAIKKTKDAVDQKDVSGIFEGVEETAKVLAVGAEQVGEAANKTKKVVTGPDKFAIVSAGIEKAIIEPIQESAKEKDEAGKAFLGILVGALRIAAPILIQAGVNEMQDRGWKL